jgi:hypothetical protein
VPGRDGDAPRSRWTVVIVDEERRLDARLRALLVHALPAAAEHLASRRAAVDAASDSRGE